MAERAPSGVSAIGRPTADATTYRIYVRPSAVRFNSGPSRIGHVRVAPATAEDVDALADLWVDLATGQRALGSHVRAGANRRAIRDRLAHGVVAGEVFLAREEGELVGFVTAAIEPDRYERDCRRGVVENLYVRPGARDAGVGGRLLEAAETALAEAGADVVALEALADNESARRFYRRHGYVPHRVELEKAIDGEDGEAGDGEGGEAGDADPTGE